MGLLPISVAAFSARPAGHLSDCLRRMWGEFFDWRTRCRNRRCVVSLSREGLERQARDVGRTPAELLREVSRIVETTGG